MTSSELYAKLYPAGEPESLRVRRGYLSVSLTNRLAKEPARMRQVFAWIRDNVGCFDVVIGDYFQRHNLEALDGLIQPEALSRAIEDGRNVARRAQEVLDSLALPEVAILCASDVCVGAKFSERLAAQHELYDSNELFRQSIIVATDDFLRRLAPSQSNAERARRHSCSYQLEEIALFELLSDQGYSVNVYPGNHLPVMKELVDGGLEGILPKLKDLTLVELKH
jgi:tRNA-dependent cyclodipeptide synthase